MSLSSAQFYARLKLGLTLLLAATFFLISNTSTALAVPSGKAKGTATLQAPYSITVDAWGTKSGSYTSGRIYFSGSASRDIALWISTVPLSIETRVENIAGVEYKVAVLRSGRTVYSDLRLYNQALGPIIRRAVTAEAKIYQPVIPNSTNSRGFVSLRLFDATDPRIIRLDMPMARMISGGTLITLQ